MGVIISVFTEILKKLPKNLVKKVIDGALDIVENQLEKDGVTAMESVVLSAIKWLREQLGITEEEGSPFAD